MQSSEYTRCDYIGHRLQEVQELLNNAGVAFTVDVTTPTRSLFSLHREELYIVRQRSVKDGCLQFVAAAKMGKEV